MIFGVLNPETIWHQ